MSDYTQSIDFSAKDALASGNPSKVIMGADIDTELGLISTAIATKLDGYAAASNLSALDVADLLSVYDLSAASYKTITQDNFRKDMFLKTKNSAARGASESTTSMPSNSTKYNITLNSESYDYGSNFASNQYTVPTTGLYLVNGSIYVTGTPTANSTLTCYIRVNASYYYIGVVMMIGTIAQIVAVAGSQLIVLTAGDTVGLTAEHNASATLTAIGGSSCNLSIMFIREIS